jgi:hypothetical protein
VGVPILASAPGGPGADGAWSDDLEKRVVRRRQKVALVESLGESIGVRFAEARLPVGMGHLGGSALDDAVADLVGMDQGDVVQSVGDGSEEGTGKGGEKCSSGCEGHGWGRSWAREMAEPHVCHRMIERARLGWQ